MCFRPPMCCGPCRPMIPPPCFVVNPCGVTPPPPVLPPGCLVSRYNAGYYCIITRVEYLVTEVRIHIEENGDGSLGPCQSAIASRIIDGCTGQQHGPTCSDIREPIPCRKIIGYLSFSRSIFVEGRVYYFEYGQCGYSRVQLPPAPAPTPVPVPTPQPTPCPPTPCGPTSGLISRYNNDYYCVIIKVEYLVTEVKIFFEINGNMSLGDLQPPNCSRVIDGTTNQSYLPCSTDFRVVIPGRKIAGSLSYQRSLFVVGRVFFFEYGSCGYSRVQLPAPPPEPVQPPQPTQPQSCLTFPSGTPITVIVTANAGFKQRVTIHETTGAFHRVYLGVGEGVQLGRDVINIFSAASTLTVQVTIEHSVDGGCTWKGSEVKAGTIVESGCVRSLTIISDDSGEDRDFNDAIVQFSWNVRPVNPLPAPCSKATIELPTSTQITVNVTTNAGWLQRAILNAQNGQFQRVYSGCGEGREIGRETFQIAGAAGAKFTLELTAEHSVDGGCFWKGSEIRVGTVTKTGALNQLIVTVDDSAGDRDFNDVVVIFTWNDVVIPTCGIVTGEYYLQAVVSGCYLDGETTEVEQFDSNHLRPYLTQLHPGDISQIWRVEEIQAGVYILINTSTLKALDSNIHVSQFRPDFVTPFFWCPTKTAANHQWKITSLGNQVYTLTSVAFNVALSGRITDPCRPYPALVTGTTDVVVHWKLVPKAEVTYVPRPCPEPETPKPTLEEGEYYIQSVSAGTYLNGNHSCAKQFDANLPRPFLGKLTPGEPFLLWKITHVGEGKYTLLNVGAQKGFDGNTNVGRLDSGYPQPFFYTLTPNAANHQWKLISLGQTYLIVNVYANLTLDANVGACKHADPEKPCPFFWKYDLNNVGLNHQWRLIHRRMIPICEIPKPIIVQPIQINGNITTIGPFGHIGQPNTFDIKPNGTDCLRIRTLKTRSGWAVDELFVQWIDLKTGSSSESSKATKSGGGQPADFSINTQADYLTTVEIEYGQGAPGYSNQEIISLTFVTKNGVRSPMNGGQNRAKTVQKLILQATEGHEIVGFFGTATHILTSLGAYVQPVLGIQDSATTLEFPAGIQLSLRVTTNAGWLQRVTIQESSGTFRRQYIGSGEGVEIGKDCFVVTANSKVNVFIEHSPDGGISWRPSKVKVGKSYQVGCLTQQEVLSEDGADDDYNDAIVSFSYNSKTNVTTGTNTATVTIPSSVVNVRVSVNAGYLQRVTLREVNGRFYKVYIGNGSNVDIGQDAITIIGNSATFQVQIEFSADHGATWKPSIVKAGTPHVEHGMAKLAIVSDDSAGDKDFDDAVVHFSWTEQQTGTGAITCTGWELQEGTQAVFNVSEFHISSSLKITGCFSSWGQNAFAVNLQSCGGDPYNGNNVGLQLVYRGDASHGSIDLYYIQNGQLVSKNVSQGFVIKTGINFEVELSFLCGDKVDLFIRQEQEARLCGIDLSPFKLADLKQCRLSGVTGTVKITTVQTIVFGSVIALMPYGVSSTPCAIIGTSQIAEGSIRPGNLKGINDYEKEVGPRRFCWRWYTRGNQQFRLLTIEQGPTSDVVNGPALYRPTDLAGYAEDYYTGLENTYFCWRNIQRGNETFWVVTIENRMEKILEPPYHGRRNILPIHFAGCNGYEGEIAQAKFYWRNFQRGNETFRVVTIETSTTPAPAPAPAPAPTPATHIVKLKNAETNRYAFCQAEKNEREGSEGGWIGPKTQNKPLIGADANYYNRAMWEVEKRGDVILLRNHESRRLIFDQAPKMQGDRGAEGGWIGPNTKKALSVDANYYNLAMWKVQHNSNGTVSLINSQTNRMLFDTGDKFTGQAGAEGGWIGANIKPLVTADANYYNRAMWHVEGPALP